MESWRVTGRHADGTYGECTFTVHPDEPILGPIARASLAHKYRRPSEGWTLLTMTDVTTTGTETS